MKGTTWDYNSITTTITEICQKYVNISCYLKQQYFSADLQVDYKK